MDRRDPMPRVSAGSALFQIFLLPFASFLTLGVVGVFAAGAGLGALIIHYQDVGLNDITEVIWLFPGALALAVLTLMQVYAWRNVRSQTTRGTSTLVLIVFGVYVSVV